MRARISDLSKTFENVSQFIKTDSSFDIIALRVLEELGPSLECQWGTYWKVSAELQQLQPFVTWKAQNFTSLHLDRVTLERKLSLSEGTAGHVWRSRKPVWTLDLTKDMCLPRSLVADSSGLTGGVWFALQTEDTVFAVIELLGRHVVPPTKELILGIESFGMTLGHLLEERLESH